MQAVRIAKIGYLVSSLAFCVAGIFLMAEPGASAIVICRLMGILFVIFGGFKICGYFAKDLYRLAFQFDLAFGAFAVALGLLMLFRSGRFIGFLNLVIGMVVLADGLFKIQMAIDAKCFGIETWWRIVAAAVVTSVLGLLIVMDPFQNSGVLGATVLLGAALLMEGLLNAFVAVYTIKVIRQIKYDN